MLILLLTEGTMGLAGMEGILVVDMVCLMVFCVATGDTMPVALVEIGCVELFCSGTGMTFSDVERTVGIVLASLFKGTPIATLE